MSYKNTTALRNSFSKNSNEKRFPPSQTRYPRDMNKRDDTVISHNNGHNNSYNNSYNNSHNNSYNNGDYRNRGNFNRNRNNFNRTNTRNTNYHEDQNNSDEHDRLIDDKQIREQLINYIYKNLEIAKYKYKLIEYDSDLVYFNGNTFYVSPNYNGINSLLVFTKLMGKYYSFIVDRRSLSYNPSQLDYSTIKIIPIEVRLDESIYNGTVIDGVLLYNHQQGIKNFVINDIYIFQGKPMMDDKIVNKMINIQEYLKAFYTQNFHLNNINFIVNTLYKSHEIKQLVDNYIPKSKHKNSIKGLTFFPEYSGTKLIYLYNNCTKDKTSESESNPGMVKKIVKKVTDDVNHRNVETKNNLKVKGDYESDDSDTVYSKENPLIVTFRMKRTDTVDVYELTLSKKFKKDNKKYMKFKKFGIAYVPTKESSVLCQSLFADVKETDPVIVECKYLADKEKWVPLKLSDKKIPEDIDRIKAKVDKIGNTYQ